MEKVTIVGGGNIGLCLVGEISRLKNFDVFLYTSKPELFTGNLLVEDTERSITYKSGDFIATSSIEEAINDADYVLCTLPAFLRKDFVSQITPFMKPSSCLGFFPAYGGAELYCKELIKSGVTIFGLQKVPYVARTKEVGRVAGLWSRKNKLFVSSIPHKKVNQVVDFLENALQIKCDVLSNYLAVTLLPGNPLLHTAGSYVYLREHEAEDIFPRQIYYYQSWDDECSSTICQMSDEMIAVCKSLPVDMSGVASIQDYYESPTPKELTVKFHSIPSFHDLTLPMKKVDNGFVVDYNSRFYTEDVPYGLCMIKSLSLLVGVPTPMIDRVIQWYSGIAKKQYFKSDGTLGESINETAAYQLFGINSAEELKKYYDC